MTELDRSIYEWQLDLPGFGEAGQERLRNATALVSRVGGLGGPLALSLAAAGIGKLVLAHAGDLRLDDLNRQILMRHDGVGKPRVESLKATLRAFNPHIEVEAIPENVAESNAASLVGRADIVFGAAPLFEERFLLNRECVRQRKPLIDCAMYGLEGQVIPIVPGETPCLACLYPEVPEHWRRRFPVMGAVSALAANIGAMEGLKLLAGFGEVNLNRLLYFDTAAMRFQTVKIRRDPGCSVCGEI
ncbi:MAG: HesA/MoeB/ThiF family protein [Verrucomicrobiae bacterium]|nr:HesA/MoeB/ThiF family protein [Verrucomicrobiae bacterium]MCP5540709.1 HesA/MoeB/ThiF family protein [Akkermansiaceae bacterium]